MAAALVAATGLSLTGPASATTRATTAATTVYVANYLSGTITPINAATDTAGPPISTIGQPYMLAATPDGRTVYVVSVDNRPAPPQTYVTPINTVTGKPGSPIPNVAGPMAIAPDGKTLYVLGGGGIVPIATATNKTGTPIPLPAGDRVVAIAISRDGRRAYVAGGTDFGQGTVTAINLVTGRAGRTICTGMARGYGPASLAITRDGSTVYAGGGNSPGNFILPIHTATTTAGTPIRPAGSFFGVMQVSPDGKTLYALAANGFLDRISVATGKPRPAIRIRGSLQTMAITPEGRKVFVGQSNVWGHVVPVNPATGIRGPDIRGVRGISLMALAPGGRTLWAVGSDLNGAGTAVPIDTATDQPGRPVRTGDGPAAIVIVRHS
jgi:DNA-binding beta-propeller fold protein YncE